MKEKEIKVLIKLNENNEIIQIGSSIFISDDTFIEIDSGFGDKFAHAQNLYLENGLTDEYGRFNYKFEADTLTYVAHPEYVAPPVPPAEPTELEKLRADVDFVLMLNGEV